MEFFAWSRDPYMVTMCHMVTKELYNQYSMLDIAKNEKSCEDWKDIKKRQDKEFGEVERKAVRDLERKEKRKSKKKKGYF